jgi:hypothetical protein
MLTVRVLEDNIRFDWRRRRGMESISLLCPFSPLLAHSVLLVGVVGLVHKIRIWAVLWSSPGGLGGCIGDIDYFSA